MALNKEWHRSHRMPPRATRERRIKWHVAHVAACGCRVIPEGVGADAGGPPKRRRKR